MQGMPNCNGNYLEMSSWQRFEAVAFPLLAAVIGIGYSVAIFANNPANSVIHSPHALILLAMLISITFFPIRSLFRFLISAGEAGDGEDENQPDE